MSPNAMRILRAATRSPGGVRRWSIAGAPNRAVLLPPSLSMWPGAASFTWPHQKPDGEWQQRTVRLDWHRSIAKSAARELLAQVAP